MLSYLRYSHLIRCFRLYNVLSVSSRTIYNLHAENKYIILNVHSHKLLMKIEILQDIQYMIKWMTFWREEQMYRYNAGRATALYRIGRVYLV